MLSANATPPSQCTPTTKASAPTSSGIDASHFPHFDAFLWTTSPAIPPSSAKIAIWLAEPPQIHSKPPPNPPHFAPTSGPPSTPARYTTPGTSRTQTPNIGNFTKTNPSTNQAAPTAQPHRRTIYRTSQKSVTTNTCPRLLRSAAGSTMAARVSPPGSSTICRTVPTSSPEG